MRNYQGITVNDVEDKRVRHKLAVIDYFLRDLSFGMGRIQNSQLPDGSGDPIIGDDEGFFFKLKGRPENQDAHGGTAPGGTLTLSSTLDPTKSFIYLGDAQQSVYDEVNERIGINQPVPVARAHIRASTTGVGTTTITPTTDYFQGGWGAIGNTDHSICVQTNDGDTTFSRSADVGIAGVAYGFTTFNTAASTTGWTLHVEAKAVTPNDLTALQECNIVVGVGSWTPGGGWTGAGGTGGTIGTGGGGPVQELFWGVGGTFTITTGYVDYQRAISSTDMASLFTALNNNPGFILFVQFVTTGGGTSNKFYYITQVSFTGPGVLDPIPLQKWESTTNSNTLIYGTDGNNNTSLNLLGDRIAVSASAFALSSGAGTPAAGMIVSAQDAIGTMHWASASGLRSLVEHVFHVNGPYRVGDEIDGAWIPKKDMTLSYVRLYRRVGGQSGSTDVTLTRNGTTTLTAPISIAFNAGASATADGAVSVTAVSAGDRMAPSAVAVDTGLPRDAGFSLVIGAY